MPRFGFAISRLLLRLSKWNRIGYNCYTTSANKLHLQCQRPELTAGKRNPIALVRVKGGSKRRQRPTTLTVDEFEIIVATLKVPYRTMVYSASFGFYIERSLQLHTLGCDFQFPNWKFWPTIKLCKDRILRSS